MGQEKLRPRIAIIDDDQEVVDSFVNQLSDEFDVVGIYWDATSTLDATVAMIDDGVAVVVVDEHMPRVSEIKILARLMSEKPKVVRILLTGYSNFDMLAEAVNQAGIFRFVAKPWLEAEIRQTLGLAMALHRFQEEQRQRLQQLQQERDKLAAQNEYLVSLEARGLDSLVGSSPSMKAVMAQARRIVSTSVKVLILGETGTGKSLLARALHHEGDRRGKIFAEINSATLKDELLESELFGHEKGAFTNAIAQKKGVLEIADGGTVFLDEVGDLSPAIQAKLLRVIDTGRFERLGGVHTFNVDIRLITATNHNLEVAVKEGRFRRDLYYRISVVRFIMPPLRERREDIPRLVWCFLARFNKKYKKNISSISGETLESLCMYRFPGNVRELENMIERAVVMSDGPQLEREDFPELVKPDEETLADFTSTGSMYKDRVNEFKRQLISTTLAAHNNNKTHTAKALGISHKGLLDLMKKLGLN